MIATLTADCGYLTDSETQVFFIFILVSSLDGKERVCVGYRMQSGGELCTVSMYCSNDMTSCGIDERKMGEKQAGDPFPDRKSPGLVDDVQRRFC